MPRRFRWLILLSLLLVVGGTLASYLSRQRPGAQNPALTPHIAADVDQQTKAFSLSKTIGEHTLYTLRAASVTNRKDTGKAILHGVSILLYGKQGNRRDRISTRECEFDPATGAVVIPGDVEMEFLVPLSPAASAAGDENPSPLFVFTSGLAFDRNTGIAATEQLVRFRFPQGEGTSQGAVYDPQGDSLILKADVQLSLQNASTEASQAANGEATQVRAGSLRFRRGEQKVYLGAPLEITQGTRKIRAGDSEILLDEQNRAQQAVLGGGVEGSDRSPRYSVQATSRQAVLEISAQGKVSLLRLEEDVHWSSASPQSSKEGRAQRVALWFPEPDGLLQRVQAEGQIELTLRRVATAAGASRAPDARSQPSPGLGTQVLTTQQAEMILAADGETLRQVRTQADSTLKVWPSEAGQKQWTVVGEDFEIEFGPQGDLSEFSAEKNVQVTAELAGKPSGKQSSRSDHLQAHFDPAAHTFDRVRQWGKFSYQDPDREARAERADYTAAGSEVLLEGLSVVWNASGRIAAEKILLQDSTRQLTASGRVSSTHFPPPGGSAREPVHAVSDRLHYDMAGQRARYQGNARLWQGTSLLVESDWIELDQPAGELQARGRVSSVFKPPPNSAGPDVPVSNSQKAPVPAAYAIRSDSLLYRQEERKAHYQGNVQMQNGSRALSSGQLEIFFQQEGTPATSGIELAGGQVERAVATENVVVVEGGRKATGDRADYLPQEGRILLVGRQATIFSPPQGLTQGPRLTYLMGDDRIRVDGEPGHRTETRGQVHR